MLGTQWAPILLLSLIAAGQSSTITGTLAGQIIMEVTSILEFNLGSDEL
jgi:Mn2+/Fe2+ NRAMP family transporter